LGTNLPIIGVIDKPQSRTAFQHGMIYYEGNLFFKNDLSCWGVYKVKNYTYEFDGERSKLNLHNKLTRLFWNMYDEFHIIDLPKETSLVEKHEQLKKRARGPLKFEAIKEIDAMTQILSEDFGDKGNKYETYLIIKFKNPKSFFRTMKEFGQTLIQDPVRLLNKISGLDTPEIYKREYEIYQQIEDVTFSKIKRGLNLEKGNEYETQFLIKYLFWFGIGTPKCIGPKPDSEKKRQKFWKPKADVIIKNGEQYIRPVEKELLRLTEADIDIKAARHIEIKQFYKGVEKTAYQAYLAIADMPDMPVPGGEWHYYLKQSLDFPIYTSIRGQVVSNKVAKDELNRKKKEIDDQTDHIRGAQEATVPLDVLEKAEDAEIMEAEMKIKKFPLIYTTIIIVVAAESKEELQKRIDAVKTALDPIPIEIPAGDQWLMMNEAMIAGEQYQKDYMLRLPPDHLALITPGASIEIGDEEGFHIAVTGSLRKSVSIAPWLPSQINRPPNATFTGSMGGGKSYTSDMIILKTCKLTGAYALFIDPKGDRTEWPNKFKTFGDEIKVTTFTAKPEDFGKLDPYIIMKSNSNEENFAEKMKEASVLALDICMFLLAIDRKDPRMSILFEAVGYVEKSENPSMLKIIDVLLNVIMKTATEDEDKIKEAHCREMAGTLKSYKNMAYAGLLFGEGHEEAISLTKQINVLQIQNLVFPEEGKAPEDFTYQEIIGYACILAITGYIKKFIMGDRSVLKIFELDESTVVRATPAGRNTMNSLHRMARSLNSPGYFIGQSVDDIGDEKIRNNIGYKFCFKTTDIKEIRKVLEYYKLEESESNVEMLSNLENGVCLFQDHEGRTAVIALDSIFEEYDRGLDTRPTKQAAGGE